MDARLAQSAGSTGEAGSAAAPRTARRDDSGSVLLLVIGFTGILLVLVAVVVDVSAVVLAKRAAASAADGAAVSAAQSLDLETVYAGGLGEQIPLDAGLAQARVASYAHRVSGSQPGLRLAVEIQARTAVVTATRRLQLPLRMPGFSGTVDVRAGARARAPTLP